MKLSRILAVLPVVLLASACTVQASSSSSSSASTDQSGAASGATAPAGTVRGVTDTSVKVGGLLFKTTSFGLSNGDEELGAKAAFEAVNDAGGINGRTIDYVGTEDDHGDPAQNSAGARKLVQQDEVFAVVPATSFAFSGADFLTQSQVPYVGYGYDAAAYCGTTFGYGFNGCVGPTPGPGVTAGPGPYAGLAKAMGGAEGKTITIVDVNTPSDQQIAKLAGVQAAGSGFTVAAVQNSVPQSPIPSDWTGYVNQVLTSNNGGAPDAIYSYMAQADNVTYFPALRAAGYTGVLADAISYGPQLASNDQLNAAFQDVYLGVPVEPIESTLPAVATMKAALEKTNGGPVAYTVDMGVGYASAQAFIAILKAAGKDLTPDTFQKAASDITIDTQVGGTVSFPSGHTSFAGCYGLAQLQGTTTNVLSDLVCQPTVKFES